MCALRPWRKDPVTSAPKTDRRYLVVRASAQQLDVGSDKALPGHALARLGEVASAQQLVVGRSKALQGYALALLGELVVGRSEVMSPHHGES